MAVGTTRRLATFLLVLAALNRRAGWHAKLGDGHISKMLLFVPEGARVGDTWRITVPIEPAYAPWDMPQLVKPRIVTKEGVETVRVPPSAFWAWLRGGGEDEEIANILLLVPEGAAPGDTWEFDLPGAMGEDVAPWAVPQLVQPRIARPPGDDLSADRCCVEFAWLGLGANMLVLFWVMLGGVFSVCGDADACDQSAVGPAPDLSHDAGSADVRMPEEDADGARVPAEGVASIGSAAVEDDTCDEETSNSDDTASDDTEPLPRASAREDSIVTYRRRFHRPTAWLGRQGTWSGPRAGHDDTSQRVGLHDRETAFVGTSADGWDEYRLLPLEGDATPSGLRARLGGARHTARAGATETDRVAISSRGTESPAAANGIGPASTTTPVRNAASISTLLCVATPTRRRGRCEHIGFGSLSGDYPKSPLQALAALE
jgi:hypothetical protein